MLGDTATVGSHVVRATEELPAAVTDIGCEREINEDRYAVVECSAGKAWVVCDGMGGELGGELAAQLAIDTIRRALESREFTTPVEAARFAIEEANRVIVLRRQNPSFSSMGTTIVMAMVRDEEIILSHCGDSRAYLVAEQGIEQLTCDHTYVQELVNKGEITHEEALSHPQAHVLTRCLGADPVMQMDMLHYWAWGGQAQSDKLVLCSDGLYSLVSDNEIADCVTKFSPQEACMRLVELAKERGGYDNITVLILPVNGQLRVEAPDLSEQKKSKELARKREDLKKAFIASAPFWGDRLKRSLAIFFMGGVLGCILWLLRHSSS